MMQLKFSEKKKERIKKKKLHERLAEEKQWRKKAVAGRFLNWYYH